MALQHVHGNDHKKVAHAGLGGLEQVTELPVPVMREARVGPWHHEVA